MLAFAHGLMPFLAALALALALTPIAKRIASRLGAVAMPRQDRWHRRPIPMLGGAAVWASVAIVAAASGAIGHGMAAVIVVGWAMCAVGLVDDFLHLKPSTKLTAQIAAACAAVLLGVTLEWTPSAIANALLTIAWIVAITNAINLLDNMDGLCAGVVAIAALSMTAGGARPSPEILYAAAIAGASVGFLVYNFNPASIFLGDSGSLFLGASIAILAANSERVGRAGAASALVIPALLLLIPLFDTAFVTLSRKLSGRAASVGGTDHTSHRLVAMGFSERNAVLVLYGLAALGGAVAVALQFAGVPEAPLVLGVLLLVLLLLALQLARVKVYGNGEDFTLLRHGAYTPLLVEITYKRRILEVLLDLVLVAFSYYAAYVVRFDKDFPMYYELLARSFPIVIGAQLVSFFIVGVYRPMWQYFSSSDLATYARGILLGTVASVLVLLYLYRFEGYSRGVFIIYAMTLGLLMVGSRTSFRILADVARRHGPSADVAVVYGAGDGGALLVREVRNNPRYQFRVAAFIDDSPAKLHRRVLGVPVVGAYTDFSASVDRYEPGVIIISTDKIPATRVAEIQSFCTARGLQLLRLDFRLTELATQPRESAEATGFRR